MSTHLRVADAKRVRCDLRSTASHETEEREHVERRLAELSRDETTSMLLEVPIVVAMPPVRIAQLTGIRVFESGIFARATTVRRIGKLRTSTGVSVTNILIAIQTLIEQRAAPIKEL